LIRALLGRIGHLSRDLEIRREIQILMTRLLGSSQSQAASRIASPLDVVH
jgi:hypothetical protein